MVLPAILQAHLSLNEHSCPLLFWIHELHTLGLLGYDLSFLPSPQSADLSTILKMVRNVRCIVSSPLTVSSSSRFMPLATSRNSRCGYFTLSVSLMNVCSLSSTADTLALNLLHNTSTPTAPSFSMACFFVKCLVKFSSCIRMGLLREDPECVPLVDRNPKNSAGRS